MAELKYWIVGLAACCLSSCNTARRIENASHNGQLSLHYDYAPDEWGFRYLPVVVQDSVRGGRMTISRDWFSGHHILQIDGENIGIGWDAHLTGERMGRATVDYSIRVPRPLINKRWTLHISPIAEVDGTQITLDSLVIRNTDFTDYPDEITLKDNPGDKVTFKISRGEQSLTCHCSHSVNLPSFRQLLRVYLTAGIQKRVGGTWHPLQSRDTLTCRIVSLADYCDKRPRYIVQEVDSVFEEVLSARISFRQGQSVLDKSNPDNQKNLHSLKNEAGRLIDDKAQILEQITLQAACSPEGSRAVNDRLGTARGHTVRKLLILEKILPQQTIQVSSVSENWDKLYKAILSMEPEEGKLIVSKLQAIQDWDARETWLISAYPELYSKLYSDVYPDLREVQLRCRFRSANVKRHITTNQVDSSYMQALRWMEEWEYEKALNVLAFHRDINTAICYLCLNQNESAASLLRQLEPDASTLYLLAIAYQRMGKSLQAASILRRCFALDDRMRLRIERDPEIKELMNL